MLNSIAETLHTQQGAIIKATEQHISISLLALLIAIVIAIPLAILLKDHRRIAEACLQVAGIVQTIPSLAILGLLIPLVGIGTVPAVIALVLYAIMPIFQNTYAGLTQIAPNLEEAATAFGLTKWKKLQRLELPLAMPMILSGIRISLVMIIGTATLAALIGGGGLGTFILTGIQSNNNTYVIIGAVLSAILAFFFSWLLKFVGSNTKRLRVGMLAIVILLVGFSGYQGYQALRPAPTEIVIAGKMGSEPDILIHMYKDLIQQEDPRAEVTLKPNFGGTTFLFKALQSNQIDVYPEFTGTVNQQIIKSKQKTGTNPQKTYQLAKRELARRYQMRYLKPMQYQNGYALVASPQFAQTHQLTKMSQLANYNNEITAGFDPDFYQLHDGYQGLKQPYGYHFKNVKTMEPAIRYQAIANGRVNVVDGYTTDPQIPQYHLKMLRDDRHFFPPYQGAPLMKESFAKRNPRVVTALNKLAGKITTKEMQQMNYEVTVKKKSAATVARQYLIKNHLLDH
ncbi:ABC transporter, substrate-binding protein, QAT family [Limosilactobacillus coleohominis 101-4-CHN]|uniref:ABC transporter, substrate-binding protein, QAT family n=1 Tax=Limosilactobacillus coleohominis 101-4-CHN TaxID=575594 RepID=C7XVG9_9LACO|nr:ABC transporter permease/substrate-binding protein [Limosilactobacillus coleohominis]EEU30335.1 ABC transporter, substrate-binding protein, QAT family [Limosilactobacillus coleohominis 101-4-CHN]